MICTCVDWNEHAIPAFASQPCRMFPCQYHQWLMHILWHNPCHFQINEMPKTVIYSSAKLPLILSAFRWLLEMSKMFVCAIVMSFVHVVSYLIWDSYHASLNLAGQMKSTNYTRCITSKTLQCNKAICFTTEYREDVPPKVSKLSMECTRVVYFSVVYFRYIP